jgi:hypothetical protein
MNRRILLPVVSLFLLLVSASAWAQFAQRGGIAGTVTDALGSVLPASQITLLDLAQNQSRQMKADAEGHFEFDNLAAGQYQLTAAREGFSTEVSEPVAVNIGEITSYNFKLHPGAVAETVTVTAEAGGLETDKISIDTNVTAQQMEELPLNGRNFTSIAALVPGVATFPQANINPGGTYSVGGMFAMGGTQFTTGGAFQGSRDNGYYVNGVNINDNYESSISYAPSAEAIGTGTIQVADFSAAVGHDISAMNMQTKGGSSHFHGEAFEFMENDDLNAFNPWDKANQIITNGGTPAIKPILKRNQFGGNLGGPVFIPKLFPGMRNRFFAFGNYENFIEHDGNQLVTASVPSAAELTGNFCELLYASNCAAGDYSTPNPNPIQLYNPFYTTYNSSGASTRPAIPNNRLDLATRPDGTPLIDPGAAAIEKALYPSPNVPNTPSNEVNYTAFQTPGISNYHIDTRFDAKITNNDSMFVTWSKQNGASTLTGGIPPDQLHDFPVQDQGYLVTANYVHIFTPRLTNEFLFGAGDSALVTLSSGAGSYLNSSSNPFNTLFGNTGTGFTKGVLGVFAGNYATPGVGEIFRAENESYQFSDNLDWIFGRHSLTAGFNFFRKSEMDWDVQRQVYFGATGGNGFGSNAENAFSSSGSLGGYAGGDSMADLEMGIPSDLWARYNISGGDATSPDYDMIFPDWGFYVNDKFRVSPKLTISAGLRYDLSIPAYTPNPSVAPCCAIYTPSSDGGLLAYPGIASNLHIHYLSAPKLDFAPRVSIAYSVKPQTVLRAGYGIFYDTGATQISTILGYTMYGTAAAVNYNVDNTTMGTPVDTPVLNLTNIFPVPLTTTLGAFPVSTGKGVGYDGDGQWASITYFDQKSMPLPYYQRMMFDLQQQVGAHDVFTLSYSGAQGRKGMNETNINLPAYQTGWVNGGGNGDPTFDAARPNNSARFGDIYVVRPNLNSFYNAMIAQYRHDFSKGFQFMTNYTWGKTVSDYPWSNTLGANGSSGAGNGGFQYPNIYNRGESSNSHRNRFVYSGIWNPTYGKRWPLWLKEPLAGWRFTGIGTMESGDALTVFNGGPGTACPVADAGTSACPTGYGSSAQDGAGFDELNISGNPNVGHGSKSFSHQFDTSKFSLPAMNVRGNSGLGTVRGPGQNRVDLSIAKTFVLYESLHLELRADAFNAFNHSQWNGVNTTYPSGSAQYPFGQVNSAGDARIGQVAAKVVF